MMPIIMKAKQLAKQYQYLIMLTILYIGLYETFRDLLIQMTGPLGIIVAIVCVALDHGKVVAGLKVVDEKAFDPRQVAAVGIKRVRDLFSTYGCIIVINLVLTVIIVLGIVVCVQSYFLPLLEIIEAEMKYGIQSTVNQIAGLFILIVVMVSFVVETIINTLFFSAPYLIETQYMTGFEALKNAIVMSRRHFFKILKFQLHYALYIIAFMCLEFLISYYLSAPLLVSLLSLVLTISSIFIYEMEYVVAKALLFQELTERSQNDGILNA